MKQFLGLTVFSEWGNKPMASPIFFACAHGVKHNKKSLVRWSFCSFSECSTAEKPRKDQTIDDCWYIRGNSMQAEVSSPSWHAENEHMPLTAPSAYINLLWILWGVTKTRKSFILRCCTGKQYHIHICYRVSARSVWNTRCTFLDICFDTIGASLSSPSTWL